MNERTRHRVELFVVAAAAAVLTTAGPALARTVADFARNADKVDGIHAVHAGTAVQARAGKLVATSAVTGRLPDNIIAKAPNADRVDGIDSSDLARRAPVAALQAEVAALSERVDALETVVSHVTFDDATNVLTFEGVNVRIVNGSGQTYVKNGLGNLIVGYDRDIDEPNDRSGSHNLVVGDLHTYSSSGTIVAGFDNTTAANHAAVLGGEDNVADGESAVVAGGTHNSASGERAAVSGGSFNTATGADASATGGARNIASGQASAVTGGRNNEARSLYGAIQGGQDNLVALIGVGASIGGGSDGQLSEENQWIGGTPRLRFATVSIDATGQTASNGSYDSRSVTATCGAGEVLLGGGGAWDVDNNTDELPLLASRPNPGGTGWTVRGGNDTNAVRSLSAWALCLDE
ncbi:MAG TPA: hypothetical protein VID47_19055 [Actinomycetota bacterium]|jgi:hypothetical protein